jgi:hypothetical protein
MARNDIGTYMDYDSASHLLFLPLPFQVDPDAANIADLDAVRKAVVNQFGKLPTWISDDFVAQEVNIPGLPQIDFEAIKFPALYVWKLAQLFRGSNSVAGRTAQEDGQPLVVTNWNEYYDIAATGDLSAQAHYWNTNIDVNEYADVVFELDDMLRDWLDLWNGLLPPNQGDILDQRLSEELIILWAAMAIMCADESKTSEPLLNCATEIIFLFFWETALEPMRRLYNWDGFPDTRARMFTLLRNEMIIDPRRRLLVLGPLLAFAVRAALNRGVSPPTALFYFEAVGEMA